MSGPTRVGTTTIEMRLDDRDAAETNERNDRFTRDDGTARAPRRRSRGITPLSGATSTGAVRAGRPAWIWPLVFLLVLGIAGLGAVGIVRSTDDEQQAVRPAAGGGTPGEAVDRPTRAAAVSAGGETVATGGSLRDLVGETARIEGATVVQVDGSAGFFVGGGKGERTFVEWGPKGGDEASGMPEVGDTVTVTGPIAEPPRQPGRTFGIPVASERVILDQGGYVNADRVAPAK